MKILLLCASQHNQVALANKIADRFGLAGIVLEKRAAKKTVFRLATVLEKILNVTLFSSLRKVWFDMLNHYRKDYPAVPPVPSLLVENINQPGTIDFINGLKPDLIVVSGTSLIRKKILELSIPLGIINLHTGLSPYVKGGPNCTNCCIADNKMHLIGNTVMWIDAGIDSGDLLTTALTTLTGSESLLELHIKVMDHAHQLCIDALESIDANYENCPRVKQASIASGTTYYNKQWNWKRKFSLLRNIKKMPACFRSEKYLADKNKVITVPL
jgi:methionyl-tRNA formyltransferase